MLPEDDLKLLDNAVRIEPDGDVPGAFCAQRIGGGKRIRLTPARAYLAENLRQPYSDVVLIAKCNARFQEKYTLEDLQDLILVLDDAGMMKDRTREYIEDKTMGIQDDGKNPDSLPSQGVSPDHVGGTRRFRNHWSLFNPESFLDFLLPALAWMRHLRILVPLAVVLAVFGFVNNLEMFFMDISSIKGRVSFLGRMVFTLFTISLCTQLYRGLTARYFRFDTPSFGMILAYGLLPRFNIRITIPENARRKARLWTLGAPIYIRFVLFPLGVVAWLSTRGQGTFFSYISAGVAMISLVSFLFVANPLIGGVGYRFLGEYFGVMNVRKKAFVRLKSLFSRQPPVVKQYMDRSPAVLVYGLMSIAFTLALIVFIGFPAVRWLERNYQGMGVAVVLLLLVYLFYRFVYKKLKERRQRRRAASAVDRINQKISTDSHHNAVTNRSGGFSMRDLLRARYLFLVLLICACFLPYQYESTGEAEVFPKASASIYAEYPAPVGQVFFNGGEILEQGTVIAELVNDRQKYDVERTREQLRQKQEELNVLLTTPSPEEVAVAREAVKKSQVMLRYSRQQFERMNDLYKKEIVSFVEYEKALRQMELDQQLLVSARAELSYIENQVNQHNIEALRIEMAMLRKQLGYYEQVLDRTRLKMPIDGRIITMNLKNLTQSYLDTDVVFARVEDMSSVRVEIRIPESDVAETAPGDPVKLRLRAYPNRTFGSRVRNIYPASVEDTVGRYVICDCIIPNQDREFRSGMTGFAKIGGREMFAVTAFTRALVRFVKVEVWSWLP